MKCHLNSLLQRNHAEVEGATDTLRSPEFSDPGEATDIPFKDGYDWLAMIKDAPATCVLARN